jgi:hypothetical protein
VDEWIPFLAGAGYVAVVVLSVLLFPRSWWARELFRRRGLPARGPHGTLTRGDHYRVAAAALVAVLVLLAGAAIGRALAERQEEDSTAGRVWAAYGFTFFVLAGVALLRALLAVAQALRWRPGRLPGGRLLHLVEVTDDGFRVLALETEIARVRWARVRRLLVFTRGKIRSSDIVLAFEYEDVGGRPATLEVSETWPGFGGFVEALPRAFPGVPVGWYQLARRRGAAGALTVMFEREPRGGA